MALALRPAAWFLAVVGWWTVQGLATASQYRLLRAGEGVSVGWASVLPAAMASAYLWIPLTGLAFWLTWRHPLEAVEWRRRIWIHLVAGPGAHLFRAVSVLALNPWVGWYDSIPPYRQLLVQNLANNVFLYWLIVGVAHALLYAGRAQERARQAEELQADLARAELANLRARLHPHFLFNALNTVASLIRDRPEAAERVVTRLAELLRNAVATASSEEIPLEDELRLVSAYLEVEKARFEERLRVVWNVEPGVERARVPPLVLQPLVENALHHGLARRRTGGTVEISAARRNGALLLAVKDEGTEEPSEPRPEGTPGTRDTPGAREGWGMGIVATRRRLVTLYGEGATLTLSHLPEGGALAEVSIPASPEDA